MGYIPIVLFRFRKSEKRSAETCPDPTRQFLRRVLAVLRPRVNGPEASRISRSGLQEDAAVAHVAVANGVTPPCPCTRLGGSGAFEIVTDRLDQGLLLSSW